MRGVIFLISLFFTAVLGWASFTMLIFSIANAGTVLIAAVLWLAVSVASIFWPDRQARMPTPKDRPRRSRNPGAIPGTWGSRRMK